MHWPRIFLFWNPLFTVVFTILFEEREYFWPRLIGTFLIFTVTSGLCWIADARTREQGPVARSVAMALVLAPGLVISFFLAARFYSWVNVPWVVRGQDYALGFIIGLAVLSSSIFLHSSYESKLEKKQLELDLARTQFQALTAQMNPHFLFNALNTVAALISTEPVRAEEATVRLAEVLRTVLEAIRKGSHTLSAELELCRAYLEIEQLRFGHRMEFYLLSESTPRLNQVMVPAVFLQPLLDNAVRHGVGKSAGGGVITLRIRENSHRCEIEIEDRPKALAKASVKSSEGVSMPHAHSPGSGTSLANSRERLRLAFGNDARIDLNANALGGHTVLISFGVPVDGMPRVEGA